LLPPRPLLPPLLPLPPLLLPLRLRLPLPVTHNLHRRPRHSQARRQPLLR